MRYPLSEKIALVTGATRGIGRDIALHLGELGAKVIGTGTTLEGAERITATLADADCQGQGIQLDVTDAEAINAAVKQMTADHGAPTILVNNAGITRDDLLLRMKEDAWQSIIDTNLTSLYRVTKACLRGMTKARNGRIINITSVVASMGNPGQTNYAAAKAGAIGFTKSLALEVAARNVTVNAVAPGFIETDMTNELGDEAREQLVTQIPLQRLGSTGDIAHAVGFLASDAAGYITGVTLHVNGGMYLA